MRAVVYDKWLHSLGGGEVVACNIARILKKNGYKVLFISGKEVLPAVISEKLKIDLEGVEFKQAWNDETAIKKYTKNADLFINTSFMDYTIGFAKKNIYYTHFPSKPYNDFSGLLLTKFVFPLVEKFIKPIESMDLINAPIIMNGRPAYVLGKRNKYALTNLSIDEVGVIEYELFTENFSKRILEAITISLENGIILEKNVWVEHHHNTITFSIKLISQSTTIYLNLNINKKKNDNFDFEEGNIYLFYPKIQFKNLSNFLLKDIIEKFRARFRAGIFVNIHERLNTYQIILANSHYTQKWVERYWGKSATVISPPVDLLFKGNQLKKYRKRNWICSVGRFFTLGHGKKQEILIEAFKLLCSHTKQRWELHLVGGLGEEPTSIDFFKTLKESSRGYPIFFHINASRDEVLEIYSKSKIYWHATGFGEDEKHYPIKFEHFGIAPIEAISAGCIPILFNGGGLREIVNTLGLDYQKNTFNKIEELVGSTIYYQNKLSKKPDWKLIFARLDEFYSTKAFENYFLKILEASE